MIQLRDYQQKAVDQLWAWFENNSEGHPCIVMPTGSGKSHVIAAICEKALNDYPKTKILMLTHVKELIEQNANKLKQHWALAPLGIYSAGIGTRDIDRITFAGIQSVRKKAKLLGHQDLILIDESHTISHNDTGMYRDLINELTIINPRVRVIGLTASPYRLGHGMITDSPALFTDIIEPTSIEELLHNNYLAPLTSKSTAKKYDLTGVHKRGGEYIEKELQEAVNTSDNNNAVVKEIIERSGERKHWLIFCTGIDHAIQIRDILNGLGITAETVNAKTKKADRVRIIDEFKCGAITALTNTGVFTTGFDYPDIDLIAMLRPTMSPGLYLQMAGRGMRIKSNGGNCLVLDFAGIVEQHGAITNIKPPSKKGEGGGVAPSKICPECDEIVHASSKTCPECGFLFPPPKKEDMYLREDDIMGNSVKTFKVNSWEWEIRTSKKGVDMVVVVYFGDMTEKPIYEYLTIWHEGYAGMKGMEKMSVILNRIGLSVADYDDVSKLIIDCEKKEPPTALILKQRGKFYDIIDREWGIREPAGAIIETNKKSLFLEEDKIWF